MSAEGEQPCPVNWLIDDVGRYLAGEDASEEEAAAIGRDAVHRGALQANELLRSAYAAHEVVATELRLMGVRRGARRTVFAGEATPVALLLLCLQLCDRGDEITLLQHTAADGTTSRSARWPFDMARAEELTRPPGRPDPSLPDFDADDARTT